jgi:hypothetical protein
VPAQIVAQQLEVILECRNLRLPLPVVHAERMSEHDDRPVIAALQAVIQSHVVAIYESHSMPRNIRYKTAKPAKATPPAPSWCVRSYLNSIGARWLLRIHKGSFMARMVAIGHGAFK